MGFKQLVKLLLLILFVIESVICGEFVSGKELKIIMNRGKAEFHRYIWSINL